jgi:DNA-binding response OmpR family regulator
MKKTQPSPFVLTRKQPTTFFPTVPIEEVPMPRATTETDSYRPSVLVVDDESVIADTLVEILNRSGFSAIPAYDGEGALETALLVPPELLISDVVLPGMSGIELAITVKRVFPDCRIILFSGQAATSDLLASASGQGHHFSLLKKPIHPTDLLARISDTLKVSRQRPIAAVV